MNLLNQFKSILKQDNVFRLFLMITVSMFLKSSVLAQSDSDQAINPRSANIMVIARADSDSIVLRWAPSNSGGWVIANQIGYVVEKVILDPEKANQNVEYERISQQAIKPLSLDEWKIIAAPENIFSAVAAQALYGKLFNPKPLDAGNMNALRNAADELSNRYSFSLFAADNDAITATALGLRFVDKDIKKDKIYAYRIFVAEKTDQYTFDTAYIVVNASPFQKLTPPINFKYESGDGSIKLSWDEKEFLNYSGYYVYRSDDDGKSYQKLHEMPLVTFTSENATGKSQASYLDTLTINYKRYKYQLRGVTAFGELSDAAEIIAFSKDLNPPPSPRVNKPEQVSGKEIKISWEMKNIPDDLQGFVVSRSDNSLDGYRMLTQKPLSKNTTEFIDDLSHAYDAYYVVASVDTAGNMAFSLPVMAIRIDTIPPAIPKGLKGKISNTGVVELSWNLGSEPNILGYRILRANDKSHEYMQLTGQIHPDTVFIDSININTLTRNIYYRIAAVNNRYQHSELSVVLELARPDIIPPGEAVFSNVFVTDSSVQLQWFPSSSEDVVRQMILKKKADENDWKIIDSLRPGVSLYIDKDIQTNTLYSYTIVSVDSSNLSSKPAAKVNARPYDSGKRSPVENFTAEYLQANKAINLKWEYELVKKEKIWFVIYKAMGDGVFKEYKAVDGSVFTFTDNKPVQGINQYGIVVMTSSGGESEMITNTMTVDIN